MTAHGFLNCNKPSGMTSRDVVNIIQGRFKAIQSTRSETKALDAGGTQPANGKRKREKLKIGHCGTLDPLAEGVLVVGVGPAVRLVPMVQQQSKTYRGHFRLGQSSPTGDLEMEPVVHDGLHEPTQGELTAAALTLTGNIEQVPPVYSAVKVDGRRAYDRVRSGQTVEMPTRRVQIDRLEILDYTYPDVVLEIVCGSGTYIRSLGIDLAEAVGTKAVMTSLTRTAIGPFRLDTAIEVDSIRDGDLDEWLLPASLGIEHLPRLTIDDGDIERLGNGLCVDGEPEGLARSFGKHSEDSPNTDIAADSCQTETVAAAMTGSGQLRALLRRKRNRWCPYRVFPVKD